MFQTLLALVGIGSTIASGISSKKSADKAADAAKAVGEFNAQIIERDERILEDQRAIINANLLLDEKIARFRFAGLQGDVKTGFSAGGIDISEGTPMRVLRQNAREFEYDMTVSKFNNAVTNMQINDAQEDVRLQAEMSRMEGGYQAASLRAQGTQSLIGSFGSAARFGWQSGIFE
tara:strand:- start:498 stop:1025 length:528 start_codon:yes stop_codon:yes gene_type:complete